MFGITRQQNPAGATYLRAFSGFHQGDALVGLLKTNRSRGEWCVLPVDDGSAAIFSSRIAGGYEPAIAETAVLAYTIIGNDTSQSLT